MRRFANSVPKVSIYPPVPGGRATHACKAKSQDKALLAVARQSLGPDWAVRVLYSTAAYSDKQKMVPGSSTASKPMGAAEEQVAEELMQALEQRLSLLVDIL